MAKSVMMIDSEEQFDFLLFGIVCQHRDYRLCRELNLLLEIGMARKDDYLIFSNKRMEEQGFAFFEYLTEDCDQFCLIANKGPRGLLIPEQKAIDYFLIVRPERLRIDEAELFGRIKEIPIVLGVFRLEAKKLKSKQNLVF